MKGLTPAKRRVLELGEGDVIDAADEIATRELAAEGRLSLHGTDPEDGFEMYVNTPEGNAALRVCP